MVVGRYDPYGIDEGKYLNLPQSQGGSTLGASSATVEINDSTMSVGYSVVMATWSTNPNSDGSSSIEPATYFKMYPKNSSNQYVNIKYCLTADGTTSTSTNPSSYNPQDYARINWWTQVGHDGAASSTSGERSQMMIHCSHMTDGTHLDVHLSVPNGSGYVNHHTTGAITASPARYLNFRPNNNIFYQFRFKTYFLGENV